jgi:hypothetical protein
VERRTSLLLNSIRHTVDARGASDPVTSLISSDFARVARLCIDRPYDSLYRNLYGFEIVKTTLDIDDELLVQAKALSARERKSLTALIEEGLRLRLRQTSAQSRSPRVIALAIHRGRGGLIRGVDPLSSRALLDAADDDA